jgi:hypothetical protein
VFTLHGIDIATKRCVGLKSTAHFRAGFTLGPDGARVVLPRGFF